MPKCRSKAPANGKTERNTRWHEPRHLHRPACCDPESRAAGETNPNGQSRPPIQTPIREPGARSGSVQQECIRPEGGQPALPENQSCLRLLLGYTPSRLNSKIAGSALCLSS